MLADVLVLTLTCQCSEKSLLPFLTLSRLCFPSQKRKQVYEAQLIENKALLDSSCSLVWRRHRCAVTDAFSLEATERSWSHHTERQAVTRTCGTECSLQETLFLLANFFNCRTFDCSVTVSEQALSFHPKQLIFYYFNEAFLSKIPACMAAYLPHIQPYLSRKSLSGCGARVA